jgi:hypothetical protein
MSHALRRWLRLSLLIAVGMACHVAHAHRLDEWLQATIVHLEPDQLTLDIRIAPGAALAARSIAEIDTDGDGRFSPAEQAAFAERIRRELDVSIDGRPWSSQLRVSSFPDPPQIRAGTGDVLLQFSGRAAPGAGAHRLRIDSRYRRADAVYLVNALQPQAASLQSLRQERSADQSSYELDFTVTPIIGSGACGDGLLARSRRPALGVCCNHLPCRDDLAWTPKCRYESPLGIRPGARTGHPACLRNRANDTLVCLAGCLR